jgi:hypothetical protein
MWILKESDARFFDAEQRAQVEALMEGILPGTEDSPGATDVGAAEYLDRLLAMDDATYYEIPGWRQLYKDGLPALEAAAQTLHGKPLTELSADERRDLLGQLSKGGLGGFPPGVDQAKLFAAIRGHTIEGCFADPRWGGNRDGAMWHWFGYIDEARVFRRPPTTPNP